MLTNRQRQLLLTIVEDYLQSGIPVGSKTLLNKHQLDISAATVRAEMNRLEDQGLIEKTHSSSGRIPSLKGYKYFIDALPKSIDLFTSLSVNELIKDLSNETKLIAIFTGFPLDKAIVLLQLVYMEDVLNLVLLFENGLMHYERVIYDDIVDESLLDQVNQQLMTSKQAKIDVGKVKLEEALLEAYNASVAKHPIVSLEGKDLLMNTLKKDTLEYYKEMMYLIESSMFFDKLISMTDRMINVKIGQEIDDKLKHVSLVTRPVQNENWTGRLTILGPVHMSYESVINELRRIRRHDR